MYHRSIKAIVEYCERSIERGYTDLRFISPDAFAYGKLHHRDNNNEIIKNLLEKISSIKGNKRIFFGSFPSEVRPDSINPSLLSIVRDHIADREIHIGLQAVSDRMLKYIRRGHTVEDVRNCVKLLVKFGYSVVVHLIFGLPGEAEKDRQAAFKEIKWYSEIGVKVRAHTFIPLPGSAFANQNPGCLDDTTFETLAKLSENNMVIGHFHKQGTIGSEIHDFIRRAGRFKILEEHI